MQSRYISLQILEKTDFLGHSIEISWFLLHLNKYLNDDELKDIALEGLIGALELGYDQEFGGITYMLD